VVIDEEFGLRVTEVVAGESEAPVAEAPAEVPAPAAALVPAPAPIAP
jgi:hypothetical protein